MTLDTNCQMAFPLRSLNSSTNPPSYLSRSKGHVKEKDTVCNQY